IFRSVQRQKDQYQGIWIVAPSGKVLAGHQEVKNPMTWTQEVLDTMNAGLKAFGPVTPRLARQVNPLPRRGIGLQSDGSVCLAIYTRYMRGGGRLVPAGVDRASLWMWKGDLEPDGPPVIDSLTLTADEWATLSPRKVRVGAEWVVPA